MSKLMYGIKASTGVRKTPNLEASLETEILLNGGFEVERTEQHGGVAWVYGKTVLDGYPGYVLGSDLMQGTPRVTHRVADVRVAVYRKPSHQYPTDLLLPMNARVEATIEENSLLHVPSVRGWIKKNQLMRIGEHAEDFVAEAMKFEHTAYGWGRVNGVYGVDCSALVQNALLACGTVVPRDSGPQSESVGVVCTEERARGDLVFWDGHVGIMVNAVHLLHASYREGRVLIEPYDDVVRKRGEPTVRRRIV